MSGSLSQNCPFSILVCSAKNCSKPGGPPRAQDTLQLGKPGCSISGMRFLKKKIQLIKDFLDEEEDDMEMELTAKSESSSNETNTSSELTSPTISQEDTIPERKPKKNAVRQDGNSKNIVKNYGKALCAFASSPLAIPYLENIIEKSSLSYVSIGTFMKFINDKKSGMNSIHSLRKLLVQEKGDSRELLAYKLIFQQVSIIFLKYFSVNWIFNGKLVQKKAHLKFRFKMLRRISDPVHFTYLKTTL